MTDEPNYEEDRGKQTQPIIAHQAHSGVVPKGGIAIYVSQSLIPIIHTIVGHATLGRRYEGSDATMIDLMPYDAFRFGVSRVHAILQFESDQLMIVDSGSMNGTWLNGNRLQPQIPTLITNGTTVLIGQMPLTIYYGSSSTPKTNG